MTQLPVVYNFEYDPDRINRPVYIHCDIFWQGHIEGREEVMVTLDKNIDMTYEDIRRMIEHHLTGLQQMYQASLPSVFTMGNGELSIEVKSW